jgi:DivIVA domain-containing protein
MALTPEDVVNKRFQSTKFREGYDQDEVDDFLDEIVIELRRLGQENEELRQRLVAGDARIAELQRAAVAGGGTAAAQAAPAPVFAEPVVEAPAPEPVVAPEPVSAPPLGLDDPNGTNNLLQLARRLHEEHVRDGVAKRDALIADGEARAQQIVAEAEERSRAQVAEVETRIADLQQEREGLERSVDELRTFEREYRASLKGFIEGQLRDLESSEAAPADAAAPSVPPTPSWQSDSGVQPSVDAPSSDAADGTPSSTGESESSIDDAPANPFAGFPAPDAGGFGAEPAEQPAPPTGWGRPQQPPFTGFGGN